MRNYHKVKLGSGGEHFAECLEGSFIGTDYELNEDLSRRLGDSCQAFNREFVPIHQRVNPGTSKWSAISAMSKLWTVSKGILEGDIVICPDGNSGYRACTVSGSYYFAGTGTLPHRRPVKWFARSFAPQELSGDLRASIDSRGSVSSLNKFASEIENLLGQTPSAPSGSHVGDSDDGTMDEPSTQDQVAFAEEEHLEEFLVKNWCTTALGKDYDILEDDGELVGQQFPTDTGRIDILATSKDKSKFVVIELKRGRASDKVVGQLLRYMGYVKQELAEAGQEVRGIIIALEDDLRLRRAIAATPRIEFFRYKIDFTLH